MNSALGFVITRNILLEGAGTAAFNTDPFLRPAEMMLQEQSHQQQPGHAPTFLLTLHGRWTKLITTLS